MDSWSAMQHAGWGREGRGTNTPMQPMSGVPFLTWGRKPALFISREQYIQCPGKRWLLPEAV